jgi:hypothetical protein
MLKRGFRYVGLFVLSVLIATLLIVLAEMSGLSVVAVAE